MTKRFMPLLCAGMITWVSCNSNHQAPQQQIAAVEQQEQKPAKEAVTEKTDAKAPDNAQEEYVDSFKVKMDSLMDANIKLPPIYTHDVLSANESSVEKFSQLSKASKGNVKILVNAGLLSDAIANTVDSISVPRSDLLILIDKTGSMADDIENVRAGLTQIIDNIKKYKGSRLAVGFYGDKNVDGMGWYEFRNFETDYDAAEQYINTVQVSGGGDIPESVYDAVMKSFDEDFWKSDKKCNIILIGDAPPLEKPLSDYTINDVIQKAHEHKVIMNFYPIIITPTVGDVKLPATEIATYQPVKLVTSLYPNPTRGPITVGLEESGDYHMEVYNASGEVVVTEEFFGLSWSRDMGNVPNGMYILRVINAEHKFELVKFIVMH